MSERAWSITRSTLITTPLGMLLLVMWWASTAGVKIWIHADQALDDIRSAK